MVINFVGTAEKDRSLIPIELMSGGQKIKLVKNTKVLGVKLYEELPFMEHSKDVYKKNFSHDGI